MRRGEIWWAELATPRGSEPGYRRPVLIVSDDRFNASTLDTVIVVALTSNMSLAHVPGNVALPVKGTGLSRPSVANVTQIATLDRLDLDARIGRVSPQHLDAIDRGLRLSLGL